MQTSWANFAKDPETGPGWSRVDPVTLDDVEALGSGGSGGGMIISEATIDPRCFLYLDIYKAVTVPAF